MDAINAINAMLIDATTQIDNFMYTWILVALLVFTGLWFSFRTKFVQIRYIKDMFTNLAGKSVAEDKNYSQREQSIAEKVDENASAPGLDGETVAEAEKKDTSAYSKDKKGRRKQISSFQALMVSTASRVGTGNIVGIATAVATGGPGAVFWMWLMAVIGAASAFVESTLAQVWKVRNPDGSFRGGPAYYIQMALGKRWLGIVFAVALILCFAFGFNGLQAYNMASAFDYYVPADYQGISDVVIGIAAVVCTAVVIFGGTQRISFITSWVVPVMAIGYILVSMWISVSNAADVPRALALVFEEAFSPQSFAGGFAGSAMMYGIKRGLFSNEAGMGSAPNAAATADVSHPAKQGLVQSLSVYIDTLLICTSSAMMVLILYVQQPDAVAALVASPAYNGIDLVQMAMSNGVGELGIHFLTIAIVLFAYSSLVGNYFYAEGNILFIKDDKRLLFAFRIFCLAAIFYGSVNNFTLAWNLADIFMGCMAIINLGAILALGKWALKVLDDYTRQRKLGENPVFYADFIEGLPPTEWWFKHDDIRYEEALEGTLPMNGA